MQNKEIFRLDSNGRVTLSKHTPKVIRDAVSKWQLKSQSPN